MFKMNVIVLITRLPCIYCYYRSN